MVTQVGDNIFSWTHPVAFFLSEVCFLRCRDTTTTWWPRWCARCVRNTAFLTRWKLCGKASLTLSGTADNESSILIYCQDEHFEVIRCLKKHYKKKCACVCVYTDFLNKVMDLKCSWQNNEYRMQQQYVYFMMTNSATYSCKALRFTREHGRVMGPLAW